MSAYLDVAVPFPIYKTFTYASPQGLESQPRPGCRVLAPFRSRKLVGMVVGLDPSPPPGTPIKEIHEVLDEEPLLSPAQIELGTWLSRFYLSPPGEAFRIMLPPGLMARDASAQGGAKRFWPTRRQLGVTALESPEGKLTARQAKAYQLLSDLDLPVLLTTFRKETGIGEAVLKALSKKGAVRIEPVTVNRSPWQDFGRLYRHREVERHDLTQDQADACGSIQRLLAEGGFQSLLLHGVTGSGKTEVYLRAIEQVLDDGGSALMMVPEIGLTPQAAHVFRAWFGDQVAILHSALGEGERFDQWRRIREGLSRVVLGTRSAVFAPVSDLGIVIVDEEHDASYKQDETPRYHAREAALQRCRIEGALAVLGSATPQLETYYSSIDKGRHRYQVMPKRVRDRPLPAVHVVDMREEFSKHGKGAVISQRLGDEISLRLERKEQVLVLINRRGYSPVLLCRSCGNCEQCENCSISLTFHQRFHRLLCHYCGFERRPPKECRVCGKEYIYYLGEGTERIQELLQEAYPKAVIDRLDRDAASRKGAYDRILGNFSKGETDILVGTQMIAKGHDFPQVTLVGVLSADQALRLADFRAAERTFQLLTQVAGRAGRGAQPGEVVIQTYFPNHYSLKCSSAQDYLSFYKQESAFRRRFRYPPFLLLANLLIQARERDDALTLAQRTAERLQIQRDQHSDRGRMRILGPAAAPLERLRGEHRFQILIKTVSRKEMHTVLMASIEDLEKAKADLRKISVDVDPLSLL